MTPLKLMSKILAKASWLYSKAKMKSHQVLVVFILLQRDLSYIIFLGKKEHQELVPENSKNNSESFDVLTGTVSPDSELFSFGLSSSSSGKVC